MKIQFYIDLPDRNLQRLGLDMHLRGAQAHNHGFIKPVQHLSGLSIEGRSLRGFGGRELNRFFPVILLLESFVQINQWQLRRRPSLPPLYESGVRYQAERPGKEDWLDIPTLYSIGEGDCEDIAGAYTAELRERHNIPAVPCIKFKDFMVDEKLITLIHVMTLMPDGTTRDPSKVLGMEGEYE